MKLSAPPQSALLAFALALAFAASARAEDADVALFKAEIQEFAGSLAARTNGAVKWAGSDPYDIRREGNALVAVIHHARLSVATEDLRGGIALGPFGIRRTEELGGKTIEFAFRLPSEITFVQPGPGVLGRLALKDAKADMAIEAEGKRVRATSLSIAGGRIDVPTTGAWIEFGPLSTDSKILAKPSGGWRGLSNFELLQIEFFFPQGPVAGVIDRVAYEANSAGPKLSAFDALRAALGKGREGNAPDRAALLAILETLPEALGSSAAHVAIEGVAVHNGVTGQALGSLKKADFAAKIAGLDGPATSLRLTLHQDGLSLLPSLTNGIPVPDHMVVDFGVENVNNEVWRDALKAAAATPRGAAGSEEERLKLLGAAAKFEPVLRIYDVGIDTKSVGLDLAAQASGSPLSPKGYNAAADLLVRGFGAIAGLGLPPVLREYLPLLEVMAVSAKALDDTPRLRFRLASNSQQWLSLNGNDIRAWFVPPPQGPGQPRLLRPSYPPLRGADVKRVQQALAAADIPVPETGVYDGATAAAVARFQKQNGLNVSGVVDAATREKLASKPQTTAPQLEVIHRAPMAGHH